MFNKIATAGLVLAFAAGAHAQASRAAEAVEKENLRHEINRETALIDTRDDLIYQLNKNNDPKNPLLKLSPEARKRLLDTLIVNDEGHISSLWIDDIQTELSPSEAYRVLGLFGHAELAAKVNNGRVDTETDRKIMALWGTTTPKDVIKNSYCNGGYCTGGTNMYCDTNSCRPPHP